MAASPYLSYSWQIKVSKVGRVIYLDSISVDRKESENRFLHQYRANRFKALSIGNTALLASKLQHCIINKAKLNSHRLVIASQVDACQVWLLDDYSNPKQSSRMLAFICSVVSVTVSSHAFLLSPIMQRLMWKLGLPKP